jgi:uncharacterized protein
MVARALWPVLLFVLSAAAEIAVPPFSDYVVDTAGLLSPAERETLAANLRRFEESGLGQMAVLTVPSLEGEPIERFGMRVAETWKPGPKRSDNGLILIIARDDRALRLEVGYGLEGVINDARAGDIIRQILVPAMRAGKPADGIRQAVDAIARLIRPDGSWVEDSASPPLRSKEEHEEIERRERLMVLTLVFGVFVIVLVLGSRFGRPTSWPRGGGGSGSFGGGGRSGFGGGGGGRFSGGGASGRW